MVPGHQHQGGQPGGGEPRLLHLPGDEPNPRPALHRAHEHVRPAHGAEHPLQRRVHHVGEVGGPMPHKHQCLPRLFGVAFTHRLGQVPQVLGAGQQGAPQQEPGEPPPGLLRLGPDGLVLHPVEEVGGLGHHAAVPLLGQMLQGLGEAPHLLSPGGQGPADGGAGEGPDKPGLGQLGPQGILHRGDAPPGFGHAGAKADADQCCFHGVPSRSPAGLGKIGKQKSPSLLCEKGQQNQGRPEGSLACRGAFGPSAPRCLPFPAVWRKRQVFRLWHPRSGPAFPWFPTVAFREPELLHHGGGPARESHPLPYSTARPGGRRSPFSRFTSEDTTLPGKWQGRDSA